MSKKVVIHGSRAVAEAAKLAKVNVISAYPITPQTHIVADLAEMIANGELKAEYIRAESEHSAISACIGASAVGVRTFTSTSSQGIALMHEVLFIASGLRLPIVMSVANRAISAPLNIWCDHQDSISQRDTGWIQLYIEDNQEALDTTLQAFKISENSEVLLPTMVCMDGFILTHTVEPVEIPDQSLADQFLPKYKAQISLDPKIPSTFGAYADPEWYMEFRYMQNEAMERAKKAILDVDNQFKKIFNRSYGGLISEYKCNDAEVIFIAMGSVVGTIKEVIDRFRANGIKVGVLKVRSFRPFPKEEIKKAVSNAKVLAVVERSLSIGSDSPLYAEVKNTVGPELKTICFVAGLGGRDITELDIEEIIKRAYNAIKTGKIEREVEWIGLRLK
ncbi:MAG: pyruvate synthase subunit PorA [Euryarchaeota archaeon]|nr:pyruvate synthase subunit PorA [Euryarchaeota archaeon]